MLFPTPTFAIFLLIVLPISWALMSRGPLWRLACDLLRKGAAARPSLGSADLDLNRLRMT